MKPRLQGKRALVTAAAQGIGEATAKAFAEQGAQVLATDINADKLDELGSVPNIQTQVLDATDRTAIESLVSENAASMYCSIVPVSCIMDPFLSVQTMNGTLRSI